MSLNSATIATALVLALLPVATTAAERIADPFDRADASFSRFPLNLLLSFAAAWLSYRFIEQPFLRLKERLHGSPSRPARPPQAP